jgi:hypothetical protein
MTKTAKILAATLLGLLVICTCASFAAHITLRSISSRVLLDDPVKVREVATAFLAYQLPPGYEETVAFRFFLGNI